METETLTKREHIATQIAIGLCVRAIPGKHNTYENMAREIPKTAVMIADALIEELNKRKDEI